MGIGIGMLAIWSEHKRKSQLLEQNHRERMARHRKRHRAAADAAEPRSALDATAVDPSPRKSLRNGVIMLS